MIIRNVFIVDIFNAVKEVNKKYDNNITTDSIIDYSAIDNLTTKYRVNLLVKDINKKGGRIGFINKVSKLACFHAHYDFFNILLDINKNAVILLYEDWIIKRTSAGKIIGNLDKPDKNRSHKPSPASFLCRCNK